MTRNEGNVDRIVRVVAGLIILSLAFVGPKSAWGYIGLLPIITGLVGVCPAYSLFGINTCAAKK